MWSLRHFLFLIVLLFCITGIIPDPHLLANPFFSNENEPDVAPPPVYSGGFSTFIKLQFEYRDKISSALRGIKKGESGDIFLLFLSASFLYGLFHAAGPGHRKTIMFSLFISHKVRWHEPAIAGFLSAGIHAGSSIAVIAILFIIQKSIITLSASENIYGYMEGITFIAIAMLSFIFIIIKIRTFFINRDKLSDVMPYRLYPLIIVSSLVPCPGATMLLLLSLYADMPGTGISGVMAMSAGMGIIISLAGYLAYAGRTGIFLKLKDKEQLLNMLSASLELLSFLIIMLFSLLMAWPFLLSILK